MHNKRPAVDSLDKFIDQVEEKGEALPTMEDLAGTSMM